ncbi:MAG: phosphoribosylformimino-5-aminoimidazole carboxamide ribotide isomerase, partial [Clostridia bacterium]|nr:phosphoribosylformimino-5-aminoimidazole carboxamide ribotide isomerase [Clostridia bacterium]
MLILPAIDIKDGQCVRLYKGDFDTVHKVSESPLQTAKSFLEGGAKYLHTVDLDGSLKGYPVNSDIICKNAKDTGLKTEVGGGIRKMEDIEMYLSNGIDRIILGSAALRDPEFVKTAVKKYSNNIAVGIDAKDGFVSVDGWIKVSTVNYIEFAKEMEDIGVKYIIFTDISTDGTLKGPNTEQLGILIKTLNSDVKIIASGGIKDINNIKTLKSMGVYGAICG